MSATQYVFPDLPDPLPGHLSCGFYRITPERAEKLLDANKTKNRALVNVKLRRLIKDLQAGKWQLNGESVIFTHDGNAHDGHHRLTGCRDSGVPITCVCVFGIDPATFLTVDTGAVRGGTARLTIAGEDNANKLAALLRLIYQWDNGKPPVSFGASILVYGPEEEQLCLSTFPEARDSVRAGGNYYRRFDQLSVSQWSFLHFITQRTCPLKANAFLDQLCDGVGLQPDSGVLLLRNRLVKLSKGKHELPPAEIMALCAKAWTAFVEGKPVRSLQWRSDVEAFPSFEPAKAAGATAQGVLA